MYFLQGGSVDALLADTSILEGWGVSRGAIALLRAVLSAAQQARQRHKRGCYRFDPSERLVDLANETGDTPLFTACKVSGDVELISILSLSLAHLC